MSERLADHLARERFRDEWRRNFAVSAIAGSGKTTAISERLAALALDPEGAPVLAKTAVVTFTNKAAAQIGRRARSVLVRRLGEGARRATAPLDRLERAFFGTIHSFCLLLAQRHGQALGLNLNPTVVAEDDAAHWEQFLEQDPMEFSALPAAQVDAFLRHAPLESIFDLAQRLDRATAERWAATGPAGLPPEPSAAALAAILAAKSRAEALPANQAAAREWLRRFREERGHLPIPKPEGTAAGIRGLYAAFFAPVKEWLAVAGAALAGELALRYRAWRFERGVQTYADQVEAALAVLQDPATLRRIREEGWRVILDEAQDTDPQQFAVLVEIAREPDAVLGSWPGGGGGGPRAGHFCMVGDGQQSIYGSRADIRNFQRHVAAFGRGDGGELLTFDVTFRTPRRVAEWLNGVLPGAFGRERKHNLGLPVAAGAPEPFLQVEFEPLVPAPANDDGLVAVLPLAPMETTSSRVGENLAAEARQIARWLATHGPGAVGAANWGEICLLAPRNEWLMTVRKELEAAGLKTSLQIRKNRSGDHPVYAWVTGLLAAVCDPENTFEWVGVLREVFGVSDAGIAATLRAEGKFRWDEPERHPPEVSATLRVLRPLIEGVDAEGVPLMEYANELVSAAGLREKADSVDPSGDLGGELERMLAEAGELGVGGLGPREWLGRLLAGIDDGRPSGKPTGDAVNLLTAHSAKGLEWPVVIPVGLWRKIGKRDEHGLRIGTGQDGERRVFFDTDSMPEATKASRERERLRELVRLLYVVLTRPRRVLLLPWGPDFAQPQEGSFLDLAAAELGRLPAIGAPGAVVAGAPAGKGTDAKTAREAVERPALVDEVRFPRRVLPHRLAATDGIRAHQLEGPDEEAGRVVSDETDPLDYGTWWHETMEFLPWLGSMQEVEAHWQLRLAVARNLGCEARAERELELLRNSTLWAELRRDNCKVFTELGVVSRMADGGWVDGVVDMVVYDTAGEKALVIDWKTNRLRPDEPCEKLLNRVVERYRPQLDAYRQCIMGGRLAISQASAVLYATATGSWIKW